MEMEDTGDDSVEQEDPREWSPQKVASFLRALGTLNVFSLPQVKCCSLELMTVFSASYPSSTCKVCVDMLARVIACVNSHRTAQMRA